MPHARWATLAIMGFAGNTSEQKVIASRNGCAKGRSCLISNKISVLPRNSCGSIKHHVKTGIGSAEGEIFAAFRISPASVQKILRSVA
jgi:hypothetical protein